ncbi:MAG: leucine--tRNA ligase [Candidatus Kapabacteria bacterium]|nr:leucine--tRNA ligase [Candidatus Kapabacteria bacterium]
MAYPFSEIEKKWQKYWAVHKVFKTGEDFSKPKFYVLDMFPYPSGAGLHIGHPEGYTATDIIARFYKMKGYNVLHPMGFDAFGLPTERYSMTTGIHPVDATKVNIENFVRQLNSLGFNYDWDVMVNTTDPNYYKWTQWMFVLIYNSWYDHELKKSRHISELPIPEEITDEIEIENYKDSKRLAFISMKPVNWCEALGTVLANEEVDEWKSKGYTVERRPMRQWMLRITEYADRLLEDLVLVDWPQSTRDMQINWIGKSEGAEVTFYSESGKPITVFTTRPDTIFGATYLVLAPEQRLVSELTVSEKKPEIDKYIESASVKSDLERQELNKDKSGIFIGSYAVNPATGNKIPIWIADYVLAHYGTGAIMAVPGHDERDHEFAKKYNLPILQVVAPSINAEIDVLESAFTDKSGFGINSKNDELSLNGVATYEAISKTNKWLEAKGIGKAKIQFKLHDWLFSRQRYWGEPMPVMFFDDGTKRALDLDELPLLLPEISDFQPAGTGESPLAKVDSWVNFIDKKTGKHARYETNTMPQWAGSCWYYLRYFDNANSDSFCDIEKQKYWMEPAGVDLYVGGSEHTVLHLLYARFWHKVHYDYGYVSTKEPFNKLFHQGLIMGEDGEKMSKSRGNVVNPDIVVNEYGADSLRLYEMFLGPLEASKPWQTKNIIGVFNFLNRVWRLIVNEDGTLSENVKDAELNEEQEYVMHSTVKKVSEDIPNLSFNTSIAQMMIFVNEFIKYDIKPKKAMETLVLCLSPFAPHISEELWSILGHKESIYFEEFPEFDESKTIKNQIELVVQVSSKIRSKISASLDISQAEAEKLALADSQVQKHLEGKEIKKVIFVKNKLINFIAG